MRGKKVKALLLGLVLTLFWSGCGSSDSDKSTDAVGYADMNSASMESGSGIYYDGEYYEESDSSSSTSSESVRAGRKLIRTVHLDVETMEFDNLLSYVKNKTAELGGYVESMDIYNGSTYYTYSYSGTGYRDYRNGSLTLRIPKDKLDGFLTSVEDNSNITNRSEQEIDVTLDYVDLDSHKAVLLAEQERLLALMEQAETIDDIIMLESRLSEIRYQIESMESKLRTYDNQIEYSTVYLNITEVIELTPVEPEEKTTWERISEGFLDSLKDVGNGIKEFFIGLIIVSPYLLVIAVVLLIITVVIYFCVKKIIAHYEKKQAKKPKVPVMQNGYGQNPYRPANVPGATVSQNRQPATPIDTNAKQTDAQK